MEKIISVRLAGRVMPIEEPAWNRLQGYFHEQRTAYLSGDHPENRIYELENGLAELLSDQLTVSHPTLQLADVDRSIATFEQRRNLIPEQPSNIISGLGAAPTVPEALPTRRFYRNSNQKWLGGVCSGIAIRLGVDLLLVRICLALLLFTPSTVVVVIVLYVLVWILAPEAPLERRPKRLLYRSRADKKLGGVCGGLALAFKKESWLFRLVFILPLVLTIGSQLSPYQQTGVFFGPLTALALLVYILMWCLLPVATPKQEPVL